MVGFSNGELVLMHSLLGREQSWQTCPSQFQCHLFILQPTHSKWELGGRREEQNCYRYGRSWSKSDLPTQTNSYCYYFSTQRKFWYSLPCEHEAGPFPAFMHELESKCNIGKTLVNQWKAWLSIMLYVYT